MGGGGHAREKDYQIVKSLIIFARDCRSRLSYSIYFGTLLLYSYYRGNGSVDKILHEFISSVDQFI